MVQKVQRQEVTVIFEQNDTSLRIDTFRKTMVAHMNIDARLQPREAVRAAPEYQLVLLWHFPGYRLVALY